MTAVAKECGLGGRIEDLERAVSEALSDVIDRGYDGHDESGRIRVSASYRRSELVIVVVADDGSGEDEGATRRIAFPRPSGLRLLDGTEIG